MNAPYQMGAASINVIILMVATSVNVVKGFSLMVMRKHAQVSFHLKLKTMQSKSLTL